MLASIPLAGRSDPIAPEAPEPARSLFFGDLHVHSSWSFDAYASRITAPPIDAYRYARGEAIDHVSGERIRLAGPPLDFMALTDHAEYLGVPQAATQENHPLRRQPLIRAWLGNDPKMQALAWSRIRQTFSSRRGFPALTQEAVLEPAWATLVRLANRENRPGEFTTFIGYEYTSNPDGQNLHRNVLFRGDTAPSRPFSAMDSAHPEALWRWMDETRAKGFELLAIPHNANGSNGLMFGTTRQDGGEPDAAWAALRARNEPVAEVMQIKGQSETHPALSPDDEWADFEVVDVRTLDTGQASQPKGSYARDALRLGLELEASLGVNPYALGLLGSTDGHNASSPFEERNYTGKLGRSDGTPEKRLARSISPPPDLEPIVSLVTKWSAAGLAGVWAEGNTRAALFDAIARRETFSTSGPRLRVRVDARWTGPGEGAGAQQPSHPMGSVLPPRPSDSSLLVFEVAAQRDPLDGPLERLQIIKGWHDGTATHERIYDIACSAGARPDAMDHRCKMESKGGVKAVAPAPLRSKLPDLETCAIEDDAGSAELTAEWRDPDYDPRHRAFYYVRVLQTPTCRWSTWDAIRLGRPPIPGVPATIQERAVTSPIWVGPAR